MNKKIFGIKISTILTFIICLVAAVLLWFYVDFTNDDSGSTALVNGIKELIL